MYRLSRRDKGRSPGYKPVTQYLKKKKLFAVSHVWCLSLLCARRKIVFKWFRRNAVWRHAPSGEQHGPKNRWEHDMTVATRFHKAAFHRNAANNFGDDNDCFSFLPGKWIARGCVLRFASWFFFFLHRDTTIFYNSTMASQNFVAIDVVSSFKVTRPISLLRSTVSEEEGKKKKKKASIPENNSPMVVVLLW